MIPHDLASGTYIRTAAIVVSARFIFPEILSLAGRARVGGAGGASVWDYTHVGSSMSVRSFMRLGSSVSVAGRARVGGAGGASVWDYTHVGSSMSVRSFMRLGSSVSVAGRARVGGAGGASVWDYTHVGSSMSVRAFMRLGDSLSAVCRTVGGSTLSCRSFVILGCYMKQCFGVHLVVFESWYSADEFCLS